MKINFDINLRLNLNRVIKYFILADLTFWSGWGILDPIFAIFIVQNVPGASLVTVGIMATIYWTVKSALQIPISIFLDKTDGEKDDFYALIGGIMLASLSMFSFMAATQVWHLYVIQFIKAVSFAFYVPAWSAIVSRHLDKDKVAFEWALDSTLAGFGLGVMGLVGGLLAKYSFNLVFILGGFIGMMAALLLILAPNLILPPRTINPVNALKEHGTASIQK